jgi:dTDP-4-amino-4,6-dideoxygalactose transaminase
MAMNSKERIYLSPPDLDGHERELLLEAYDSNWITTLGPHVDAFEVEICRRAGVRYAAAVASGTSAIHLALINLGIQRGDEVLCSTFTFAGSVYPIVYCGGTPVFIDSNRETWNLYPELLDEELASCSYHGKRPKAIIVVDLYGQCADYEQILGIAAKYDVQVIEDAAEALGATYGSRPAGSMGAMGILSFNGNKIITTSGGGMLLSDNKDYIEKAKFLSMQARDPGPYYQHSKVGYNYRLSNLLAAVGRAQLENLDKKVTKKRAINSFYRDMLQDLPGIHFMPEASYGRSNCWLTCMTIDPEMFGATNEDVRYALEAENIESRPTWKPMHLQPVFSGCRIRRGGVSDEIFARGLCLPSGTALTEDDLRRIVDVIRSIHVNGCDRGCYHKVNYAGESFI